MRMLYLTSSSFSGSTLLSFLLNAHPKVFTAGEMDGWNYEEDTTFLCSCGAILRECPFYLRIAGVFHEQGLPFDFREFGTAYRLGSNPRWNRYLTGALPLLRSTSLERLRDALVWRLPRVARTLSRQDRANRAFIQTALDYSGAEAFVDACKDPFRMRHLRRIPELDLKVLYLVRDPRGVALSNMTKRGWSAALAARVWVREQASIQRVSAEAPAVLTVYYDELCDDVNGQLARIHEFLGVPPIPFGGDLAAAEHHILGNVMRLENRTAIKKDTRWQRELSAADLETIERTVWKFARPRPDLAAVVGHFLDGAVAGAARSFGSRSPHGSGGRA